MLHARVVPVPLQDFHRAPSHVGFLGVATRSCGHGALGLPVAMGPFPRFAGYNSTLECVCPGAHILRG